MCWYCIRLDIYSILVLAYCFANKSFTKHHRTLSKWWATEETPTLEALDCSFPCFLCYTLVCKPWRFHFLHGWSLIYGIFFRRFPHFFEIRIFVQIKRCQSAFLGKGAEMNLSHAFLGEIFAVFHRKYLPFFSYLQKNWITLFRSYTYWQKARSMI